MFDVLGELNWLVIILATVAYYALAAPWFAQFMFGKAWNASIGFQQPKGYKFNTASYIVPLIGSLLASIATAVLIYVIDVQSLGEALLLGLIVGIGYAGSVSLTNAITPTHPHPFVHGLINGGYHVLGIIIAAVIIFSLK